MAGLHELRAGPNKIWSAAFLFSTPYCCAMALALLEFMIEHRLAPSTKSYKVISSFGVLLIVIGEIIRKTAILQAKASFTHKIAFHRKSKHRLVTTGIYGKVRHPGYLGWLLWAVGTQILLLNPVCSITFALVSWRFFRERIAIEEDALLELFGEEYGRYADRVPTCIPFIP